MRDDPHAAGWHEVLLALSGRIPIQAVAAARAVVTDDAQCEAQVITGMQQAGAHMSADEIFRLVGSVTPGDAEAASDLFDVHSALPMPEYRFSPLHPAVPEPTAPVTPSWVFDVVKDGPGSTDLTGEDPAHWTDETAILAVTVANAEPGVLGLWGSWRQPGEEVDGPDVRAFLVEVDGGVAPDEVAVRFQKYLTTIDETTPSVDVFGPKTQLAPYQRSIRGAGSLLWSARTRDHHSDARFDRGDQEKPKEAGHFTQRLPRLRGTWPNVARTRTSRRCGITPR